MGEHSEDSESAYAKKLRIMLELIAHPNGGEWTGQKMKRATEDRVQPSYFNMLRDGDIGIPRADKVEAMAEAMGFPVALWFKSLSWWEEVYERWKKGEEVEAALAGREESSPEPGRVSDLLNHLFEERINEETGQPFTEEEVALQSKGALSEREVKDMSQGHLTDPTLAQILALCDIFEVEPSYWRGGRTQWRPSPAVLKAAMDPDSYAVYQNGLRLSKRNRGILKMLSEQLRSDRPDDEARGDSET